MLSLRHPWDVYVGVCIRRFALEELGGEVGATADLGVAAERPWLNVGSG